VNWPQCFRGDSTDAEWKTNISSCILYSHSCIAVFDISWIGLGFLFFSLKQHACAGQFEMHKTFLKNQISQANFQCSASHGLQAFYFKPLEGL